MKFKIELALLVASTILFAVSTLMYSYQPTTLTFASSLYPYRSLAIPLVSFGSLLMVYAAFSYSRRSKNCM